MNTNKVITPVILRLHHSLYVKDKTATKKKKSKILERVICIKKVFLQKHIVYIPGKKTIDQYKQMQNINCVKNS